MNKLSTQPPDLLAPLLALEQVDKAINHLRQIGWPHVMDLEDAREVLAAHRGEAVGEVVRSSPEVMIGRIHDQTRVRTGDKLYAHPPQAQAVAGDATLAWAVERWHEEVANRPLVNKHRRSLDDVWRQVIRHCGADDVSLCGPRHDELLAALEASQ